MFSVGSGVNLKWKSDDVLLVNYSGPVLRQQKRLGDIRVEYLPIGTM